MTHLEPLDPRTLLSTTVDTSFGSKGTLAVPGSPDRVQAAGGAVYVVASKYAGNGNAQTRTTTLYKYTAAGKVDTRFGTNGRVVLTLPAGVDNQMQYTPDVRLAYDEQSGKLYVAQVAHVGVDEDVNGYSRYGGQDTLVIRRFDGRGRLDTAYGDRGNFVYGSDPFTGTGLFRDRITVGSIVPLSGGRLLVGMERENVRGNADFANERDNHDSDIALMRLRDNGRRDPSFGRGGVVSVNRGSSFSGFGDHYDIANGTELKFGDLRVNRDGTYRVVDTGRRFNYTAYPFGNPSDTFSVSSVSFADSTTIDASGREVEGGFRATITTQNVKDALVSKVGEFEVLLAAVDGRGIVVAGSATPQNPSGGTVEPRDLKAVRLTATTRQVSDLALPAGAKGGKFFRDDGVTYFFTDKGTTRFSSSLVLDKRFGRNGTLGGVYNGIGDGEGRLLTTDATGLRRYVTG